MSANGTRTLTVVLPHSPQDQDTHDRLVAAACALHAKGGWGGLEVMQCVASQGMVEPRGASAQLAWCEVANAQLREGAESSTCAAVIVAALGGPEFATNGSRLLLTPPGPAGEELAASLAAALGAPSLGRCVDISPQANGVKTHRMAFGGRLSVELETDAPVCCGSWRPQGAVPALAPVEPGKVKRVAVSIEALPVMESEVLPATDGQSRLEGARMVVSGGRGMAGAEGFELLGRIAARLGAAVGGSLPAVDAGWVPVARQVGQSGKFVSPQLYFAVGISGTPQHLAGIASTSRIVAVNSDPAAPIFAVADVGVVADWRELLPLLAEKLLPPADRSA